MWLTDPDLDLLKNLSESTNLSQTEILTQVVHAGLQAISAAGNRITLPLVFRIADLAESPRRGVTKTPL